MTGNLTLDSATGIGGSQGTGSNKLQVSAATLAARTRSSGDIDLTVTGATQINSAVNGSSAWYGVLTASSSNGSIDIETQAGTLDIQKSITADGSGSVTLTALATTGTSDDVNVAAAVSSGTGTITITGDDNVNISADITTGYVAGASEPGISITTTNNDITQTAGAISTTGTSGVAISAGNDFTQSGGSITSGTYTTVSAGGDIAVDPITAGTFIDLRANGDIAITGNLEADGNSATIIDNSIYLRADDDNDGSGNITFDGTSSPITITTPHGVVLALADNIYSKGNNAGDVTFNIGGDMTSGDGRVVSDDGSTPLEFSLAFIASNNVGDSANPVLLTATGPSGAMAGSFVTIADGYLNLIDTTANDFSHDPDVVTGGHLAFHNGAAPDGLGSVTVSPNSVVNSGQDITIIAPEDIALHNSSYSAPGDILVHSTTGNVVVDSGVDMEAGTDGVAATSGGITLHGATGVTITAGTNSDHTTLTAEDSIIITADSGDVNIGDYVDMQAGTSDANSDPQWPQNIEITATSGNIKLGDTAGYDSFDAYGNVEFNASGNIDGSGMAAYSTIRSRDLDVNFTAGGSINTGEADVTTGVGDIVMSAGSGITINGTITPTGYFDATVDSDGTGSDGTFTLGSGSVLNLNGDFLIGSNVSGNNVFINDSGTAGSTIVTLNGEIKTDGDFTLDLDTPAIAGDVTIGGSINAHDLTIKT